MLKVRKYGWKDCVYSSPELAFGDAWAATSYLLRVSEELNAPVRVRSINGTFKQRVNLITPHLNTKGAINFVDKPIQAGINYCEMYSAKFVPTKKTWTKNNSNIIAYQFDGFHLRHQKNLPIGALNNLINSLKTLGYYVVDVGHKKPIGYIVETLANCKLFVGCPSGLSVVCMSARTPICLITRNLELSFLNFLKSCQYKTRPDIQMYRTVKDFLSSLGGVKLKLY